MLIGDPSVVDPPFPLLFLYIQGAHSEKKISFYNADIFFPSPSPILHPKWAHQKYYKNRITGVFVCATTMGKNGRSAASTHKN
jgi:hypothetical protein